MQTNNNAFDAYARYVRVRSQPQDKFVEFDFAIGHPELFVELILPKAAFEQFCTHNRVQFMDEKMQQQVDADIQKWRFGDTQVKQSIQQQ